MKFNNKEYHRQYYLKNKEKILARSREHYRKNKQKINERNRLYRKSKHGRIILLAKKFSVSYNEALRLLNIQRCEICGSGEVMATDHCHICNKVRGRLCYRCNRAIGALGDTVDLLEKAVEYLKTHTHKY